MKKEMKKEMKNWNGTIELRPHWSSHTHVCRCVADASQRAHSISFQGIHLYMVYMVYTGAEIAARKSPGAPEPPSDWTSGQVLRVYTYLISHSNFITWCLSTSTPLYYYYYTGKRSREDAGDP